MWVIIGGVMLGSYIISRLIIFVWIINERMFGEIQEVVERKLYVKNRGSFADFK